MTAVELQWGEDPVTNELVLNQVPSPTATHLVTQGDATVLEVSETFNYTLPNTQGLEVTLQIDDAELPPNFQGLSEYFITITGVGVSENDEYIEVGTEDFSGLGVFTVKTNTLEFTYLVGSAVGNNGESYNLAIHI